MATDPRHNEIGVHLGWVLPPALAAIFLACWLGVLGPTLLALLVVPNVFGVHMLLSWQWALAVLIAELADVRAAAPCIAAFGYCIVGCPYYALNVHMMCRMGIDLPDRVKFGWAKWITCNLYNFSEESKSIVTEVLKRGSITLFYKAVFLQFDLLCHLLPMIISLQRHAQRITPGTILLMAAVFLCWACLLHRRHYEWIRPYETLQTWRLVLVPAPRAQSIREHMQITYLTDPALSVTEQNLGLGVACTATGLLLYLTATERHAFISTWLAWGKALPVALLQTLYCILIVTAILTTMISWFQIFCRETHTSEKPRKAK